MQRNEQDPFADLYPQKEKTVSNIGQINTVDPFSDLYGEKGESINQPSELDVLKDIFTGRIFSGQKGKFSPPVGLGQMVSRAVPKLAESAAESAGKGINLLQEQGYPALESIAQHPINATRTATAGMGDLLQKLLNLPRNTPQILSNLELLDPELAKKLTSQRQFDLSKYTNKIAGEEYPGSELIRKTFENLPVTLPVGKALTESAIGTAKTAAKLPFKLYGKEDPVLQAQQLQKEMLLGTKQKELEEATEQHEQQQKSYAQAKAQAQQEGVSTEHNRLVNTLREHDEKINEARIKSQELQENLSKLKEEHPVQPLAPEEKEIGLPEKPKPLGKEHEEKVENLKEAATSAEDNLVKLQENNRNIEKLHEKSDKQIGDYLESGSTHGVRIARIIAPKLEEMKKSIQEDTYKKLENNLQEKNVIVENTNDVKELDNAINKLISKSHRDTPEGQAFIKKLQGQSKRDIIPANDYVSSLKSINGFMRDAFKKAFEPGINEEQRVMWRNRANELKQKSEEMYELLKQNIGEENIGLLDEGKRRWKHFAQLYEEPLYWKMIDKNKKQISETDLLSNLRGAETGSGLEIINNMIKSDEQALKHVVGQRYDAGQSVHQPNELLKEYTDLLPGLKPLIGQRAELSDMLANSKEQIQEATRHKNMAQREAIRAYNEGVRARKEQAEKEKTYKAELKEYTDYQKVKDKYHKDLEKYGEQTKEHTEKVNKAEKNVEEHNKELEKLNNKKEKIKRNMDNLRTEFEKENISFEKKNKLGKEIDKIKEELRDTDSKIDKTTTGMRFYVKAAKVLYKAANKTLKGF